MISHDFTLCHSRFKIMEVVLESLNFIDYAPRHRLNNKIQNQNINFFHATNTNITLIFSRNKFNIMDFNMLFELKKYYLSKILIDNLILTNFSGGLLYLNSQESIEQNKNIIQIIGCSFFLANSSKSFIYLSTPI